MDRASVPACPKVGSDPEKSGIQTETTVRGCQSSSVKKAAAPIDFGCNFRAWRNRTAHGESRPTTPGETSEAVVGFPDFPRLPRRQTDSEESSGCSGPDDCQGRSRLSTAQWDAEACQKFAEDRNVTYIFYNTPWSFGNKALWAQVKNETQIAHLAPLGRRRPPPA